MEFKGKRPGSEGFRTLIRGDEDDLPLAVRMGRATMGLWCRAKAKLACTRGQGTTEYAILVGVLVVIAILAISVFRPRLQELWDAIANSINAL